MLHSLTETPCPGQWNRQITGWQIEVLTLSGKFKAWKRKSIRQGSRVMILDRVEPAKVEDYVAWSLSHLFPAPNGVRHSPNTNKQAQIWSDGGPTVLLCREREARYSISTYPGQIQVVLSGRQVLTGSGKHRKETLVDSGTGRSWKPGEDGQKFATTNIQEKLDTTWHQHLLAKNFSHRKSDWMC